MNQLPGSLIQLFVSILHLLLATEENIYRFYQAKIFSVFDIRDAFQTNELTEESSLMTTMHTPQGRYRWTRLPFGISSAKWEVTVDYYSDFYEIDKLPTIQSSAVIQITKQHFVRHGIPHTLIADSGAQFASDLSKTFAEKNQFNHFTTSPYWSQSNGRAKLLSNQQNTSCSQLTMWTQLHYPSATPPAYDKHTSAPLSALPPGNYVYAKPPLTTSKAWILRKMVGHAGPRSYLIDTGKSRISRNRAQGQLAPPRSDSSNSSFYSRAERTLRDQLLLN